MRRLLIRPGAIGDCILSFPVLEWLRAEYTEVWVPSAVVPLIDFADAVCSIASTQLDLLEIDPPARLRERLRQFDSIVSWYGAGREEFRDCVREYPFDFHRALPEGMAMAATDFYAGQVGAPRGMVPRIRVKPASRDAAVIQPFSGSASKNWPLERFRELAEQLPCPVEWCAGPDEELAGATRFESLRDLADWIGGARLYVGNDSGVTHLAAATGVPVVALFGPTSACVWGPRGESVRIMQSAPIGDLRGSDVVRECLEALGSPRASSAR